MRGRPRPYHHGRLARRGGRGRTALPPSGLHVRSGRHASSRLLEALSTAIVRAQMVPSGPCTPARRITHGERELTNSHSDDAGRSSPEILDYLPQVVDHLSAVAAGVVKLGVG